MGAVRLLPPGQSPAGLLRLVDGLALEGEVTVTGVWGWHDDWSNAWIDSGDTVQDAPLTVSATTLTVTNADGLDTDGRSPRFQVGHLLRVDDEYLHVRAIDTTTNTLTVTRGVNGTTAATHVAGTPISVYRPAADVESLVLRWAGWLYREPDGVEPEPIPSALLDDLRPLRRDVVRS